MPLADLLLRPSELTLDGAAWPILFDHAALIELERLTGLDVLAGELDLWRPTAKQLRAALFVTLRRAGWGGTVDQAGGFLVPGEVAVIRGALIAGWIASSPRPNEDLEDDPDPIPQKRRTWAESWAIARHDLRLTESEWLAMTPGMADEISRRYFISIQHNETMLARIAAEAANAPYYKREGAVQARDFMIHPPPIRPQTFEDLLAATDHLPRTEGSI